MSIIWKYLDKRSATVEAIKDYSSMDFIVKNTDDKIRNEYEKMKGISSPSLDGMPHGHNPKAEEDRMVKNIEEIDVLKERYRQAQEYMKWFVPAWEQLDEDEQFTLDTFYTDDSFDAASAVADHCKIERSSAYRKKNRALDHLTVLLFGKE